MTLEETKKLIFTIKAIFPKTEVTSEMIEGWFLLLEDYELSNCLAGLKNYARENKFTPSISEIISEVENLKTVQILKTKHDDYIVKVFLKDERVFFLLKTKELAYQFKESIKNMTFKQILKLKDDWSFSQKIIEPIIDKHRATFQKEVRTRIVSSTNNLKILNDHQLVN